MPGRRRGVNLNAMRGSRKPIRFWAEFLFLTLLALLCSCFVPCPMANASDSPPAMLAAEGLVRLDAVVTDQSGIPVTGLTPGDFKLLDNGEPVPILSFSAFNGATAKPDAPVEVILAFDDRGAFAPQAAAAAQEIGDSLKRIQAPLGVPVSVVQVSKFEVIETPRPSTDASLLAGILQHPHDSDFVDLSQRGYGTGLAVGLTGIQSESPTPADFTTSRPEPTRGLPQGLNALGEIAIKARGAPGRKLLIWIGPEWNSDLKGSAVADWITEFSTRLREAHIAVYCTCKAGPFQPVSAGLPAPSLKNVHSGDRSLGQSLALESIAVASGGGVLKSSNIAVELAQKIKDANDFYSLVFAVPHAAQVDEYHELKLEVNRPDLRVDTNTGYFDQPAYYDQPPPTRSVTVAQLEQLLLSSKQMGDRECAREIAGVSLTERMSDPRRHSWLVRMPGAKSRSALEALADLSVLLDPPLDEFVSLASPDESAQRDLLARVSDYLSHAIPRLPDFFAVRTTVLYHQAPGRSNQTWKTAVGDQSLQVAETTKTTIVLRHGRELVEKEASRKVQTLRSEGAFGPILSIALLAVESAGNNMKWLRWEQGAR